MLWNKMGDSNEYQERLHHEQLTQFLADYYENKGTQDISKLIEQIQIVEKFSIDSKRILCLFSNPDFYFKYISRNIEDVIGFTPAEIYNKGLVFAYKLAYWKQLSLPLKIFQWGERYHKLVSHVSVNDESLSFFCGVKMKDKQGVLRTFFIRQKVLSYTEKKRPLLSYMEIEEITNIFKRDFAWARFKVKTKNEIITRAYFTEGKKKEYSDILSTRELEILRLVSQHKNSMEISEFLGIAKNTVERHRKNMIARVGVADMTGLIHICQLCQLV